MGATGCELRHQAGGKSVFGWFSCWLTLLAAALLWPGGLYHAAAHDPNNAYNHDVKVAVANNPRWMGNIPDSVLLSQLSIPGTHDTMATWAATSMYGESYMCQVMTLRQMLDSGVRFVDIRCMYAANVCLMSHAGAFMFSDLDQVFTTIAAFLAANPSEAVIMRLKSNEATSPTKPNTRPFKETWATVYRPRYAEFIWDIPAAQQGRMCDGVCCNEANPRLGEIRRKVLVMGEPIADFTCNDYTFQGSLITSRQDDYWVEYTANKMHAKWLAVKGQLIKAAGNVAGGTVYINFLSGNGLVLPCTVASGHVACANSSPNLSTLCCGTLCGALEDYPRDGLNCAYFEGTNMLAEMWIRVTRPNRGVGIVVADYPGGGLINTILSVNTRLLGPSPVSDLYLLTYGGTATTEVHALQRASNWQTWAVHEVSALSGSKPWSGFAARENTVKLLIAQGTNDLYAVRYAGAAGTELYVMTAASNYKTGTLYTTGLHATDATNYDFQLDPISKDLVVIKFQGTKGVEVHTLSSASGYKTFALHCEAAIKYTTWPGMTLNRSTLKVLMASDRNLVVVKYNGASGKTEVHEMGGTCWSSFQMSSVSVLHPTTYNDFDFQLDNWKNVHAVKYKGGTNKLEVHVLTKVSGYKSYEINMATPHPATTRLAFAFGVRW